MVSRELPNCSPVKRVAIAIGWDKGLFLNEARVGAPVSIIQVPGDAILGRGGTLDSEASVHAAKCSTGEDSRGGTGSLYGCIVS